MPTLDPTRSQIDPEALRLIEATGHSVLPGAKNPDSLERPDRSPNWDGLSFHWWKAVREKQTSTYLRLIAICEEDYPTFAALLLRVYNKSVSRVHPFIFNQAQRYAWNVVSKEIAAEHALFVQFLKARQVGVSTLVLGKHFWHAWRERDLYTTIIAHQDKLARTLVRTLSLFYDELPDLPEIRPRLRQMSRSAKIPSSDVHFSYRNGMEWRSTISTHVAKNIEARGAQSKHILESEYAFYPDPKGLNDALMPQLPPLGSPARLECSVIIESTPNGQNHFYDMWQLAKSKKSEWIAIFLPWFISDDLYSVNPDSDWKMTPEEKDLQKQLSRVRVNEYDGKVVTKAQMYWRRLTIIAKADTTADAEMAFDQEFPSDDETCFLLYESQSLFKDDMRYLGSCISEMEDLARKECTTHDLKQQAPIIGDLEFTPLHNPFGERPKTERMKTVFKQKQKGRLSIWEFPKEGHIYVAGSDSGDIADSAVTHVCCVTCAQQAAELITHGEGVEVFTDHTIALCRFFSNALWMPEVNHVGSIMLKRGMVDWGYGRVARDEKWDEPALKKNKYGHYTTEQTKPILVSGMKSLIQERFYRIASKRLRSEMSTFQSIGTTLNGNPRFAGGRQCDHDDTVMAMALALRAVRQSPKLHAEITTKRHVELPSAVDLGLNDSPQVMARKMENVPEAVRMYFEGLDEYLPSNPIRGPFLGMW